jgi:hypothetical protein
MDGNTASNRPLLNRAADEFKSFLGLSVYLYVGLGAMLLQKTATLADAGIPYTAWGVAVLKALVLAKFMLVGHAFHLGERHRQRPLIWPTLYMALMFLILLLVLTTVEEITLGLIHHRALADSLARIVGPTAIAAAGNLLVMYLILLPYCAFRSLGAVIGDGVLLRLFFIERVPIASPGEIASTASGSLPEHP